jgi:hypothetical protein
LAWNPVSYERKVLEAYISLHEPSWANWSRLIYRGLGEMVEKGSGGASSLHGNSVKGIWREGSLAGNPEGQVEKALETHLFQ